MEPEAVPHSIWINRYLLWHLRGVEAVVGLFQLNDGDVGVNLGRFNGSVSHPVLWS